MRKLFQALALLAAFVLLIALPQAAADGVRSALTLCGRVILPSLFPFFVCSNLFLLLGYSARLSARFGGAAAKLLRLPPAAGSAFLLGLLGGYPAGAQAAGTLGVLLGEDMAFKGMSSFNLTILGQVESLLCTAMGFQLGHR